MWAVRRAACEISSTRGFRTSSDHVRHHDRVREGRGHGDQLRPLDTVVLHRLCGRWCRLRLILQRRHHAGAELGLRSIISTPGSLRSPCGCSRRPPYARFARGGACAAAGFASMWSGAAFSDFDHREFDPVIGIELGSPPRTVSPPAPPRRTRDQASSNSMKQGEVQSTRMTTSLRSGFTPAAGGIH